MRAGGPKSKGNNYENQLAKELSLWLTDNVRSDVLERSPASGGKATSARKRNVQAGHISGDLIATCDEGYTLIDRFVIEAKHRNEEGINVNGLVFATSKGGILAFWLKLLDECQQTNKLPMLVFRQNNRPSILCLCKQGVELFHFEEHIHAVFNLEPTPMYMTLFAKFLLNADSRYLES